MKKSISLLLMMCLLQCSLCIAKDKSKNKETKNYFSIDHFDKTLETGLAINSGLGWDTYTFAFQPYFQLDTKKTTVFTGMQLAKNSYDFTLGGIAWPYVGNRIKLGLGARYHINYYDNLSLNHDFLTGGFLEARPASWFGIKLDLDYMIKARRVFAIYKNVGYLKYNMAAFNLETDFYVTDDLMFYTKMTSYELYRYMINFAPSFTLGFKETNTRPFYFATEITARFIDFFTASAFYDNTEMRLLVGIKL